MFRAYYVWNQPCIVVVFVLVFLCIDIIYQNSKKRLTFNNFDLLIVYDDSYKLNAFYFFDKVYFVLYSFALCWVACSSNLPGTEHVLFR